jgi:D-arabinose 1-dehydrogenase-like Zn-dependent alcohol dehydrogenase
MFALVSLHFIFTCVSVRRTLLFFNFQIRTKIIVFVVARFASNHAIGFIIDDVFIFTHGIVHTRVSSKSHVLTLIRCAFVLRFACVPLQVARHQGREVFAFTREGDVASQDFARRLGAQWAGASGERPPVPLDASIIFAPVGALVPAALEASAPGAVVVCAGIHMSQIPAFDYKLLWMERSIRSVANLTRRDGEEFLELAPRVGIKTSVTVFPLEQANEALDALRHGRFDGAAVLDCS